MESCTRAFQVSSLYSNEEIYKSLGVGNTGGVRPKLRPDGEVERVAVFTSFPTQRQIAENPYQDRLENDVLVYTGAGKEGDQVVSGANARLLQQFEKGFPIYAFTQIASRRNTSVGVKRWAFLGLLEYLRCYQEKQLDSDGKMRTVWVFEFLVHSDPALIFIENDSETMCRILDSSNKDEILEDREIANSGADKTGSNLQPALQILEPVRRKLLSCEPRDFKLLIREVLIYSGFESVEVTRFSQDGGIDVTARPGKQSWPLQHLLIQIQAKRWLHTVGRKEVAELRGSLQPHAAGCIVTTSHFSKAAILESSESGKVPITVIDGYQLSSIIHSLEVHSFTHLDSDQFKRS